MTRKPPTLPRSRSNRAFIEFAVIVMVALCLSRWAPVKRFYAMHAPVWAARGTVVPPSDGAAQIVAGARAQIGTVYDSGYLEIAYPNGDVPSDRGACSDVVVRAFRAAGVDLQRLIHEDMLVDYAAYPPLDQRQRPDPNIDHRRTLIQMRYFERHGRTLTRDVSPTTLPEWQPGDVVYWDAFGEQKHVGVLTDDTNANGVPLVIHNGSVCLEQDCLMRWRIIGHFRFPPPTPRNEVT
jgi:uncharacterized protein